MHPDELNKPLGLGAESSAHGREIPWKAVAFGGLGVLGAGIFAFAHLTSPPQPESAPALAQITASKAPPATPDLPAQAYSRPAAVAPPPHASASQVEETSGVRVVRQGGASAPGALIISIPQAEAGLDPAPDPRLVENGRFGPLPKIGADGAKPMDVYGRALAQSPALPADAPRVAILIGGMGLNAQATESAIAALPAAVTLGFAPYGRDLATLAAKARAKGHETILQAPMQGFGGEAEDPGPHVLRTGAGEAETISRLHWHMSRFQGYAGVAGFMGARFTSDATAFRPVLAEIARRGLFYFEDGGSPRSLAVPLATAAGAPVVRADVTFDADPAAIDAALAKLETIARDRGFAIGYGTGLPAVVDKVGRFARRLEARGVTLAPVSDFARDRNHAAARVDN